jgi:hypothetical protein
MMAEVSGGMPAAGSSAAIGWLALTVFGVLAGINAAFKLKDNLFPGKRTTEINPQPLTVQLVEHYVRKEECLNRHNESLGKVNMLERQLDKIQEERRVSSGELHEKINLVALDVAGLKTSTELQNQKLNLMDSKLDRIVEKRLDRMTAQL